MPWSGPSGSENNLIRILPTEEIKTGLTSNISITRGAELRGTWVLRSEVITMRFLDKIVDRGIMIKISHNGIKGSIFHDEDDDVLTNIRIFRLSISNITNRTLNQNVPYLDGRRKFRRCRSRRGYTPITKHRKRTEISQQQPTDRLAA